MKADKVLLDHGSGGQLSDNLIRDEILPVFNNKALERLGDGAVLDMGGGRFAFSTDSYVVDPIFFPGGSIGDLAVNGTVNDISMCGAIPLYLSAGLIIEEGFPVSDLRRVLKDMANAAQRAGVEVVTGDTKVVQKGAADGIFINTSGIGIMPSGVDVAGHLAQPGDKIILSGSIADHGITILAQREGLRFEADIKSDSAPLNILVRKMFDASRNIHVLRDPTRGGVGTVLNEIAEQSQVGLRVFEEKIPVKKEVAGICELLGFDPMYVANEGKLIALVREEDCENVLQAMRMEEFGKDACVIGEVMEGDAGKVHMRTRIGGERIVHMLSGEQLPRIC